MLAVDPRAIEDARQLDRERAEGRLRGPLHGIPIVLKDNIESSDPLPAAEECGISTLFGIKTPGRHQTSALAVNA
jgi:amidase